MNIIMFHPDDLVTKKSINFGQLQGYRYTGGYLIKPAYYSKTNIRCAMQCVADSTCTMYNYNSDNHICELYRPLNNGTQIVATNWNLYRPKVTVLSLNRNYVNDYIIRCDIGKDVLSCHIY